MKSAFLMLCDQTLKTAILGGKIIKIRQFCFIETKCESNF